MKSQTKIRSLEAMNIDSTTPKQQVQVAIYNELLNLSSGQTNTALGVVGAITSQSKEQIDRLVQIDSSLKKIAETLKVLNYYKPSELPKPTTPKTPDEIIDSIGNNLLKRRFEEERRNRCCLKGNYCDSYTPKTYKTGQLTYKDFRCIHQNDCFDKCMN